MWKGKLIGVNHKNGYKRGCRPYTTKEYKDLIESLGYWFTNELEPVSGPVDLTIKVKLSRRRDTDNIIKPIMDALQAGKVVENDNQIRDIHVYRHYHKPKELDELSVQLEKVENEK